MQESIKETLYEIICRNSNYDFIEEIILLDLDSLSADIAVSKPQKIKPEYSLESLETELNQRLKFPVYIYTLDRAQKNNVKIAGTVLFRKEKK